MNNKITNYNEWLYEYDYSNLDLGLYKGKIGLCVYWYIQSRCYNNHLYEEKASELLDSVLENIQRNSIPLGFENGIIGIYFAILYLIKNGYVEGDIEVIFRDVDDIIYRDLYFEHINCKYDRKSVDKEELLAGIYIAKRLQGRKLPLEKEFLFKRLLIEIVNRLTCDFGGLVHTEPSCFNPLSYTYLLLFLFLSEVSVCGFYNKKISLLLDDWAMVLSTVKPFFPGHSSFMYLILKQLSEILPNRILIDYLDFLKRNKDDEFNICDGFFSRDITISNGMACLAIYAHCNKSLSSSEKLYVNNKIEQSILWKEWEKNTENKTFPVGLFETLSGSIISYQIINFL